MVRAGLLDADAKGTLCDTPIRPSHRSSSLRIGLGAARCSRCSSSPSSSASTRPTAACNSRRSTSRGHRRLCRATAPVHGPLCEGYAVCCVKYGTCTATISSNELYYEGGCWSAQSSRARFAGHDAARAECLQPFLEEVMGGAPRPGIQTLSRGQDRQHEGRVVRWHRLRGPPGHHHRRDRRRSRRHRPPRRSGLCGAELLLQEEAGRAIIAMARPPPAPREGACVRRASRHRNGKGRGWRVSPVGLPGSAHGGRVHRDGDPPAATPWRRARVLPLRRG